MGAGCSGSVVASRLSEIESVSVLLLEAGRSATPETAVPSFVAYSLGSDIDWRIKGKPQGNSQYGYTNNVRRGYPFD